MVPPGLLLKLGMKCWPNRLTIVAFWNFHPENFGQCKRLHVSGNSDISIGNVIGSLNIANIANGSGISGFILPF